MKDGEGMMMIPGSGQSVTQRGKSLERRKTNIVILMGLSGAKF